MKHPRLLTALALLASAASSLAQLSIPSANGSDGAFSPAANIEVDLSLAIPGDALSYSNSGGDSGKGIYDSARWVVVYKYSSVNIPAGVTVTFKNHPSYAPVVWLVQGSVNVAGTVNLNGKPGVASGPAAGQPSDPGPGGFRGGAEAQQGPGAGLGVGGTQPNQSVPALYSSSYGNPSLIPLIGGSGGSGYVGNGSGGAGGGAILVATPGTLNIGGTITAQGGAAAPGLNNRGSGGGIRLVAGSITGSGNANAGTEGRVRMETQAPPFPTITTNPATAAIDLDNGATPTLFQSLTSPTVKIVSVDGLPSPADPTAPLVSSADIAIQKNTPVTIVLETRNFATAGAIVAVRIANKYGGATTVNATLQGGGTTALSTWTLNTTLAPGFVTLQARATQN